MNLDSLAGELEYLYQRTFDLSAGAIRPADLHSDFLVTATQVLPVCTVAR